MSEEAEAKVFTAAGATGFVIGLVAGLWIACSVGYVL